MLQYTTQNILVSELHHYMNKKKKLFREQKQKWTFSNTFHWAGFTISTYHFAYTRFYLARADISYSIVITLNKSNDFFWGDVNLRFELFEDLESPFTTMIEKGYFDELYNLKKNTIHLSVDSYQFVLHSCKTKYIW